MKYGLLGRKLSHSYSPAIHQQFGNHDYGLFEIEPDGLEDFLRHGTFEGLNVTMPYKKTVIPYLDDRTDIARRVGAVNTIYRKNGKLIGHNTDFYGFQQMLHKSGLNPAGKKCLVLGSGGASDVAVRVLEESGAMVVVISRSGENNYNNLSQHYDAAIIVNATPVGMYPHCGQSPIDIQQFSALEGVLDVIYNPARTQLLLDAENQGLITENGLWMLVNQAREAASLMTQVQISDQQADNVYRKIKMQMENIILIGMPGCGKSTIGQLLAEQCGKTFVDTDDLIVQKAGKTIPQIFAEDGEEAFRILETEVLKEIGMQSSLVISTGGGCVTQTHNYPLLHQNGRIFWLQRGLEKLSKDGRPLSLATSLEEMYAARQPLYNAFADDIIGNNGSTQSAVDSILEQFV